MKTLLIIFITTALASCATVCTFPPPTKYFPLQHAPAEEVAEKLKMEEAERGNWFNIVADTRTNCVIVGATLQSSLIPIERRIRELDAR